MPMVSSLVFLIYNQSLFLSKLLKILLFQAISHKSLNLSASTPKTAMIQSIILSARDYGILDKVRRLVLISWHQSSSMKRRQSNGGYLTLQQDPPCVQRAKKTSPSRLEASPSLLLKRDYLRWGKLPYSTSMRNRPTPVFAEQTHENCI